MTCPTPAHIRDVTGHTRWATTGPNTCDTCPAGQVTRCHQGGGILQSRVTQHAEQQGNCNPGLLLLGPSICGTPNPCTAGLQGQGVSVQGQQGGRGSLSCCSHRQPRPHERGWRLVTACHRLPAPRRGAGGREHLLGCHGTSGSGAAARTPGQRRRGRSSP